MAAFLRDADRLRERYGIGTGDYTTVSLDSQVTATQRAIRPQALALAVFAALVAVIGLAVTGQLLARQLALDAADFPVLRAIGQTRAWLAAEALLRLALVTVAGGVTRGGRRRRRLTAAAHRPRPAGRAASRRSTPTCRCSRPGSPPSRSLPLVALAPAAWRAARRRAGRPPAPSRRGAPPPVALPAPCCAGTGSATRAIGVRMAFDAGARPHRRAGAHRAGRNRRRSARLVGRLVFGSQPDRPGEHARPVRPELGSETRRGLRRRPRPGGDRAALAASRDHRVGGGRERRGWSTTLHVPAIALDPSAAEPAT